MTGTVTLEHRTTYRYGTPAVLSPQVVRLKPTPYTRAPIRSYELTAEPTSSRIDWSSDRYGNEVALVTVAAPTDTFVLDVKLDADLVAHNPFDFVLELGAVTMPVAYGARTQHYLAPYRDGVEVEDLGTWTGWLDDELGPIPDLPTIDFVVEVARMVAATIAYEIRYEPGVQSVVTTIGRRAGSCRDSAWLLVETFRAFGLAARFASGYLVELDPDGAAGTGSRAPGSSTELHAWAEVYLPGAAWIGLDPTSGLATGVGHIPLATAPTPREAAPVTGTSSVPALEFSYANSVVQITAWPDPDPDRRRA